MANCIREYSKTDKISTFSIRWRKLTYGWPTVNVLWFGLGYALFISAASLIIDYIRLQNMMKIVLSLYVPILLIFTILSVLYLQLRLKIPIIPRCNNLGLVWCCRMHLAQIRHAVNAVVHVLLTLNLPLLAHLVSLQIVYFKATPFSCSS